MPSRANWFRIVEYAKEACKANSPSENNIVEKRNNFSKSLYGLVARGTIVAIGE